MDLLRDKLADKINGHGTCSIAVGLQGWLASWLATDSHVMTQPAARAWTRNPGALGDADNAPL